MPKGWTPDKSTVFLIRKTWIQLMMKGSDSEKTSTEVNQEKTLPLESKETAQDEQLELEKKDLESQINEERERIALQTKYHEQIAAQKAEVEKIKKRRPSCFSKPYS